MNKDHLLRGIQEFNRGYFFEAHDILEDLWRETSGPDRLFLQGLIQVSVGFYHFANANYKGASSQLSKGLHKLEGYRPAHGGVELQQFTTEVARWYAHAHARMLGEPPPDHGKDIPKISYEH